MTIAVIICAIVSVVMIYYSERLPPRPLAPWLFALSAPVGAFVTVFTIFKDTTGKGPWIFGIWAICFAIAFFAGGHVYGKLRAAGKVRGDPGLESWARSGRLFPTREEWKRYR